MKSFFKITCFVFLTLCFVACQKAVTEDVVMTSSEVAVKNIPVDSQKIVTEDVFLTPQTVVTEDVLPVTQTVTNNASVSSLQTTPALKIGDTFIVPDDWEWVTVEFSISNGNNTFNPGESCGIKSGGTLTVLGIENKEALVKYYVPGKPYGTPCPNGTIFIIAVDRLVTFTSQFNEKKQAEKLHREKVQRMFEQSSMPKKAN